jgi:EmrB/QacA subfamily drug resistance transporter
MLASKQLISIHVSIAGHNPKTTQPPCPNEKTTQPPCPNEGEGAAGEHTARRGLIFGIVSIALFMASIDQTIVATALPAIEKELHSGINWSSWSISIYALGQVIAMPMAGKISDIYGRKKVFMISAAVFTVASLCCGFTPNIAVLLAFRFIQALGGGAFMPSATGIVSDHFGSQRDRAVGMFASIFPIGGIVGPVVGGLFVSYWTWRGIFLINVPIGIVLLLLTARYIPASAPREAGRIDLNGVMLLAGLLITGMFGITYLGSGNVQFYDPGFVVPVAASIVFGFLFARHSKRDADPFVPYRLLRGRSFGIMNVINYLHGAAALGFSALVPLYAENRYGIAPLGAGTLLTARAVGMMAVAALATLALRRTGYRWPMVIGFTLLAVGMVLMVIPAPFSPYGWLSIGAAVTGVGMGTAVPATNNACLQLAPDQAAAITGLRGMFRQSGAITAVSVTTAVLARSAHPGITQAYVFAVFAVILVVLIPMVRLVPEHHGGW